MKRTTCGTCLGDGHTYVNDTNTSCPDCQGKGYIEYEPTPDLGILSIQGEFGTIYEITYLPGNENRADLNWLRDENGQPLRYSEKYDANRKIFSLEHPAFAKKMPQPTEPPIDYSADSESGDANRITPDAAGECVDDAVTVAPATPAPVKPQKQPKVDALYIAWHAKMDAMLKFGRYAAQTVSAYANFDKLFATRTTR